MNNKKLLVQQGYWFGDINVHTNEATQIYNGTALTNPYMICQSTINDRLFQTGVSYRTTGTQTEVGWSFNTYELTMIWPRTSYHEIIEDLGILIVYPQTTDPEGPEDPDPIP